LKYELGVAPDAETRALAKEIARSGGAREPDAPKAAVETADLNSPPEI
jgi:hypothetical protein